MTRFETPGQVVLLFAGAAIVSVVLVAFLNVEARNRKIKEPEIENDNMFEVFGKQIIAWIKKLRHHHHSNHTESGAHLHRIKRSLKSVKEDEDNKVEHPMRHHGKHRRKLEPVSLTHNVTSSPVAEDESNQTDGPLSRPVQAHELCYNTNQVLLIIAVTCAVNFAFIFIVMSLVHLCNRSSKTNGMDSLVQVENGDCEHKLRRENSSYSSVQEYVNSLPSSFERTASMLSLHSIRRSQDNLVRKTFSMEDLLFMG